MSSTDLQYSRVDSLITCPGFIGWLLPGLEVFFISGEREAKRQRRMLRRRFRSIMGRRRSIRKRQRLTGECLSILCRLEGPTRRKALDIGTTVPLEVDVKMRID